MWVRTKEKLINTRHLAEISIKSHRMNSGTTMFELTAVPARKENQTTALISTQNKEEAIDLLAKISSAIGLDTKEYIVEHESSSKSS